MANPDTSGRIASSRRDLRASTKTNSDFKWKSDRSVVGGLEIVTDPDLDVRASMIIHEIRGHQDEFNEYYKVWEKLNLRDDFIKAFESIPPETTCCGLVTKQDETITKNSSLLNKGWVKSTNENLLKKEGFRISIFVWSWTNLSGKSETVVPMIRFHRL